MRKQNSFFSFLLLAILGGCGEAAKFGVHGIEQKHRSEDLTKIPYTPSIAPQTFEQDFTPLKTASGSQTLRPSITTSEQTLLLTDAATGAFSLRQGTLDHHFDTFTQGHDVFSKTDSFTLAGPPKLDLLVVFDNSSSMDDEKDYLAASLPKLVEKLDGIEWQIGVVTMASPCFLGGRAIKWNDGLNGDSNKLPATAFNDVVSAITLSNIIERGFPTAITVLKEAATCSGQQQKWLRDGATVGILVVSDEDNCGSNNGAHACDGETGAKPEEMIDFLNMSLKDKNTAAKAVKKSRFYGIYSQTSSPCPGAVGAATNYEKVVAATGGTAGSICGSFGDTLGGIGVNARIASTQEFVLSHQPEAGSVHVVVAGTPINSGYSVEGKKLELDPTNSAAGELVVSFDVAASPKFIDAKLSHPALGNSIQININNSPATPGSYEYDKNRGIIVFGTIPPDQAKVDIRYSSGDPLPKSFVIAVEDIIEDSLVVSVAGVKTTAYTYDAGLRTITLQETPSEGVFIEASYKPKETKRLSYPINLPPYQSLESFAVHDAKTNNAVPFVFDGKALNFTPDQIQSGRMLRINMAYRTEADENSAPNHGLHAVLPNDPITSQISITADPELTSCVNTPGKVEIAGSDVTVSCPTGVDSWMRINYTYVVEKLKTLTLDSAISLSDTDLNESTWTVLVNQQPIDSFTHEGHVLTINGVNFDVDSTLKVRVTSRAK